MDWQRCFLFDKDGAIVKYVRKSPAHNVYVYVDRPLLDPVLKDHIAEIT